MVVCLRRRDRSTTPSNQEFTREEFACEWSIALLHATLYYVRRSLRYIHGSKSTVSHVADGEAVVPGKSVVNAAGLSTHMVSGPGSQLV